MLANTSAAQRPSSAQIPTPQIPATGPELVPAMGAALSGEFDLWHDVFVERPLPWKRFVLSAFLHGAAVYLICTLSLAWVRERTILDRSAFDRASLVTYTPEEYLPPLDTGEAELPAAQKGDPVYAQQPILSVPREADNRSQTIVVPPDLKLDHDVPLPNIVATGAIAPAVPLDATADRSRRIDSEVADQVVAPAPEVASASNRNAPATMNSEVVAPPPEVTPSTKGRVGVVNVGPSDIVAPAPQLTLAEQHTPASRRGGRLPGGGVEPVAPPPSMAAGNGTSGGRLIALSVHPAAPAGPVAVPAGNRRGTFAATPQGKPGASGTPAGAAAKSAGYGSGARRNGTLPSGLYVGAAGAADGGREMAGLSTADRGAAGANSRVASPIADDKITDLDRQVFGGKRVYGRTLNMPNLNSSSGSWVIKFAELDGARTEGELLEPVATEQSDPGYPLELMRANVHGMVTLYAVIHPDGQVGEIRVLNSPDERLDSYAAKALARWKFVPGEKAGKPVALEAVVMIPFRVRRSF